MKRNPHEQFVKQRLKTITVKRIRPFLLYHQCCKCGMEYKLEPMFECSFQHQFFDTMIYHTGCSHCFSSKDDFRQYLEDNKLLYTKDSLYKEGISMSKTNTKVS